MKSTIFLMSACLFFSYVIAEHETDKDQIKSETVNSWPEYLQEKRQPEFVEALIYHAQGEKNAIDDAERELLRKLDKNVDARKKQLCSIPSCIIDFLLLLFGNSQSDLEIALKNLEAFRTIKYKEVREFSQHYKKSISKINSLSNSACDKIKKDYRKIRAGMRQITHMSSTGEYVIQADQVDLTACEKTTQDLLFPKMLHNFHNCEIPVTQEEIIMILQANQRFLKQQEKRQQICNVVRTLHEERSKVDVSTENNQIFVQK